MGAAIDRSGPPLGFRVWNALSVTFVVCYLALIVYGSSIPGAGSIKLSFLVVALFMPVIIDYLWIAYNAIVLRYLRAAALVLPLLAFGTYEVVEDNVAQEVGWSLMQDELEYASETHTCPWRAGLVPVEECTVIDGHPAYDFGSGPTDQVLITQATTLPDGYNFEQELTDGWRVVLYQH